MISNWLMTCHCNNVMGLGKHILTTEVMASLNINKKCDLVKRNTLSLLKRIL